MAVELATGYVSIVPDTRRVRQELERAFGQAGNAAGAQGGEAAGGGIADALGGMGGKGGMIGAALGSAFALAGVSVGGLFVKALQQGMERERVLDTAQARLGVDDATMQKIGTAAGRAYVDAFGGSVEENIDTARRAIQAGLIDPNATAQETQAVISQLSGISDLMGEEIPAVARAAGQAIKTGIAVDAAGAFDLLAAAERNGLNVSEDVLDTVTEYGTQFRKLGLDGADAFGLINQAVKAGARDVDIAADAIKEFSIRVVDGSDSTNEAFETLGLNAEEMAAKFAAGGESARDATRQILAGLRGIEDPLERGQIAVGLFGTQWEDLGGAFDAFDLDTAAASLGKVAGAAQDALTTMGGNAATSIESAKRSIQVSADEIGGALAQAFGPSLAKAADWVTNHQPEILGFLGGLVDGAFAAADAFLSFSVSALDALAMFAEAAGPLLASVLDPLGLTAELFGKLTRNEDLTNLGHSVQELDSKFATMATTATAMADGIELTVRPGLDRMRQSIGANITEAQNAEIMMRALGDSVTAIPSEKGIILSDNSPEVTARLEQLGLKVVTLPDGSVEVQANTEEGQRLLNDFIARNTGRPIPLKPELLPFAGQTVSGTVSARANGGIDNLPGQATIWSPHTRLYQVSEPETGGEAFIPLATSKRNRSIPIWLETGRRLGLISEFAAGAVVPGKAFAQSMDPAQYLMGGFSKSAIDCSGMVAATINDALGLDPFGAGRMSTVNEGAWLTARGARPGLGGPGDISVGWFDRGGGANGHTALTLGDGTNVESRSGDGVVVGGDAAGANDPMFDQHMHIPAELLRGGDMGGPASAGGAPSGGGSSPSGAGGSAPGASGAGGILASGNAAGGVFAGQEVPAGVVPVWVINAAGNVQPVEAAPVETVAPPATPAQTQPAPMPDMTGRALEAGGDFLNANVDQLLGDLGLRRSGGAIQALVSAITEHITAEIAAEMRAAEQRQRSAAAPWMGR